MTQQQADELLKHAMKTAKENKDRKGYSGYFTQVAICVGPNRESSVLALEWKNNREKAAVMHALAKTAKEFKTQAIVIVNDVRWLKSDSFSAYFKLPKPGEISLEEWQQKYLEILNTRYHGTVANMPPELWSEALVVAIKGPYIKQRSLIEGYREGVGDSIMWDGHPLEEEFEAKGEVTTIINVLPEWWEEPDGKPN